MTPAACASRRGLLAGRIAALAVLAACTAAGWSRADAGEPPSTQEALDASPGEGFRFLGRIAPRHARQITSSNWSVGAETMDRDFTVYAHWKRHLGPLGTQPE